MAQQLQQPKSASSTKHGIAEGARKLRQSRQITAEQRHRMIAVYGLLLVCKQADRMALRYDC
jgi:hypothetical protein